MFETSQRVRYHYLQQGFIKAGIKEKAWEKETPIRAVGFVCFASWVAFCASWAC